MLMSAEPGVCHVIHIFFGSSLGKVKLPSFIIVGYMWQPHPLPPHPPRPPRPPRPSSSVSSSEKAHPE